MPPHSTTEEGSADARVSVPTVRTAGLLFRILVLAPVTAILWLQLLTIPTRPPGPMLDDSWNTMLARDLVNGAQFGIESIFTYGPFAYLFSPHPPFDPQLFETRLLVEYAGKGLMALVLVLCACRHRRPIAAIPILLLLLAVAPHVHDTGWLVVVAALSIDAIEERRTQPLRIALACIVIAVLGLAKFTLFVLGTASMGAVVSTMLIRRRWRFAIATAIGQVLAIAGAWIAAGQSLANLPAFVHASLEIANGYNLSMAVHGPTPQILLGLGALACLGLQGALALWQRPLPLATLVRVGIVGLAAFMSWKAGFVRQDDGHVLILFTAAAILPVLLPGSSRPRLRWAQRGCAIAAVVVSAFGYLDARPTGLGQFWKEWRHSAAMKFGSLMDTERTRREAEAATRQMAEQHSMPQTKAAIGRGTVDLLTFETGLLHLHGFEVRHRPVIQSYSAYTPFLQRQNEDFLVGPQAPDYLLVAVHPIDGRFAMTEDSGSWRAILRRYVPVLNERGYALMRRRENVVGPLPDPAWTAGTAKLGEWVPIPTDGRVHELAIELHPRILGRLRSFALRPAALFLDVRTADGREETGRISESMVRAPFVIDPLIKSTADVLRSYTGLADRIAAFRVRTWSSGAAYLGESYDYRLRRNDEILPEPQTLSDADREALMSASFPMFSPAPLRTEPVRAWLGHRHEDRDTFLAEPPMRLLFGLRAGNDRITATYGMFPAAYEGSGRSDGATIRIALRGADGTERELFTRHLDPLQNPADRGKQVLDIATGEHDQGELVIETLPGPNRDNRWDFVYWQDVAIRR